MSQAAAQAPALRSGSSARNLAIDQFRGFAILLMVLADYLAGTAAAPAWLKHADDIGYTVIDLIAPLFVFAIGLTFGPSFRRRVARDGRWAGYTHFITRNLALIGLGFLLTLAGSLSGVYPSTVDWGLLQALGAAGLLTLIVIPLPPLPRAATGLLLLAGYQVLLDRFWLASVLPAPHNGPWGALSWGAMLILATSIADVYHDPGRRKLVPWLSLLAAVAGLALAVWVPISKDRASMSYALLSLGLSGLVFLAFDLLIARFDRGLPILSAWGKNALLLYLLHGVVIGLFALPVAPWWYAQAAAWLVALQAASLVALLGWIGLALDRLGLYFSL
jgi:predicted acyltransferase